MKQVIPQVLCTKHLPCPLSTFAYIFNTKIFQCDQHPRRSTVFIPVARSLTIHCSHLCWRFLTQRSRLTCWTRCESACCSSPPCWWSTHPTTFMTTTSHATASCGASWPSPGHACCPKPAWTLPVNTAAIYSWRTSLQSSPFTRRLSCRWGGTQRVETQCSVGWFENWNETRQVYGK